MLRLVVPPPAGFPRGSRLRAREADGDPLHRARWHGRQPRLRGGHLRQWGRPLPARERRVPGPGDLDRPHRLRHPRPAPDPADEEGARAAPREPGHRPADARRGVLGAGGRPVQRRARLQDLCPGHSRRDRDGDRRQLLRLLQEGGQDPDLVLGEPVRQRRGGAFRRRAGLRQLQPGPGIHGDLLR